MEREGGEVSDLLEGRGGRTRRDTGEDGEAGMMLFCQCFPPVGTRLLVKKS